MVKSETIQRSKNILNNTPVFAGTRVPIQTLIDYFEAGDRLNDFLDDFPTVKREQALKLLELAKETLLEVSDASST